MTIEILPLRQSKWITGANWWDILQLCWFSSDIRIEDLRKCVPAAFSVYQSKVTRHSLPDFHCWAGFNKTVFLSQYSQLLQICSGLAEPVPPVWQLWSKQPQQRSFIEQMNQSTIEKETLYFLPFVCRWGRHQVCSLCLDFSSELWTLCLYHKEMLPLISTQQLWFTERSGCILVPDFSWMTTRCPVCVSGRDVSAQSFQELCECNSHENEAQSRFVLQDLTTCSFMEVSTTDKSLQATPHQSHSFECSYEDSDVWYCFLMKISFNDEPHKKAPSAAAVGWLSGRARTRRRDGQDA